MVSTLNVKYPVISLAKRVYSGIAEEIPLNAFWDIETMANHKQVQRTKERSIPLYRKGGIREGLFRKKVY